MKNKNTRVMVSTEENSSSSEFAAALAALKQSGMSLEALAGVRGVASWANPAKPIEAFSYGLGETPVDALAEAALAYTHEESLAAEAGTQARPPLQLVASNDGAAQREDDAAETLQDAESVAIRAEASQLLAEIQRMDSEVKADLGPEIALLKAALQNGRASGVDFERIRDRVTAVATNAASAKAESPEQKRERLWNEIEALNKKTLEGIDALKDNGLMDKKEADQWKDELTEIMAMENGEEKAKRLADFNKRYGDRLEQVRDSLPLDDDRRKLLQGLIKTTNTNEVRSELLKKEEGAPVIGSNVNATNASEPTLACDDMPDMPNLADIGVRQASELASNRVLPKLAGAASADIGIG